MWSQIIHPGLHNGGRPSVDHFFATHVTIQQATSTISDYGDDVLTWANLAGHVGLDCAIAPAPGPGEVKAADGTYVVASHLINLAGYYPLITEKMRALIGASYYDILLAESDSQSHTTRLAAQIVE
jgi:hypothetical protein